MARIVGVDLPKNKRGEIGLTYIYGVGRSTSRKILDEAGIGYDVKVQDWNDEQIGAIRSTIAELGIKVEGECRSLVQLNIKHRLLSRHPSPSGSSRSRSEHQEQCAYPQRPQEDCRKQEKGN